MHHCWEHCCRLGLTNTLSLGSIRYLVHVVVVVSLPRMRLFCLILHLGNTYVTLATCCNCRNKYVSLANSQ